MACLLLSVDSEEFPGRASAVGDGRPGLREPASEVCLVGTYLSPCAGRG